MNASQLQPRTTDPAVDLLQIARDIEAMKRDCGMDPESPTAIYNARLMAGSLEMQKTPPARRPWARFLRETSRGWKPYVPTCTR